MEPIVASRRPGDAMVKVIALIEVTKRTVRSRSVTAHLYNLLATKGSVSSDAGPVMETTIAVTGATNALAV